MSWFINQNSSKSSVALIDQNPEILASLGGRKMSAKDKTSKALEDYKPAKLKALAEETERWVAENGLEVKGLIDGKIAGNTPQETIENLMHVRRSESKALGQVSRKIESLARENNCSATPLPMEVWQKYVAKQQG